MYIKRICFQIKTQRFYTPGGFERMLSEFFRLSATYQLLCADRPVTGSEFCCANTTRNMASMPVQPRSHANSHTFSFRISRYFLFLKTPQVSQFSILNLQIFGSYKLSPAPSISDTYKVLMSGFQLPKET